MQGGRKSFILDNWHFFSFHKPRQCHMNGEVHGSVYILPSNSTVICLVEWLVTILYIHISLPQLSYLVPKVSLLNLIFRIYNSLGIIRWNSPIIISCSSEFWLIPLQITLSRLYVLSSYLRRESHFPLQPLPHKYYLLLSSGWLCLISGLSRSP